MEKRAVAIIQARMASTRLPGKILLPMMDKTMLEQIIRRVRSAGRIDSVVVATTDNRLDDIVEKLCRDKGVECFRADEENVLERFYLCARQYQAEIIVRITADDPLKDPEIIAKALELFEAGDYDYVSNTLEPTYPEGLDIEVFSRHALEKAYLEAGLKSEKEHVTPYIYKNPDRFKLLNFKNDTDLSKLRWTVDSPEDYLFVQSVYEELYGKPNEIFRMEEVCELLRKKPYLQEMNRGHVRNEGYQRSLRQETSAAINRRICGNEYKYVGEVLDGEFRSSKGARMMQRLEKAFAEKIGVKYAIALVNGTCTLHSVLEAAGIGAGDEVIVPPLTMSSTAFAVLQANATPVFADVDPDTFLISPVCIKDRITPNTKAVITVSLYGLSPDMDAIMELAGAHRLLVIEDNAQCMLGSYKGRRVGTLGHAASYSFQSSKHLTSGEGGMVVTDSLELAQAVRRVSSLGYAGVGASKAKITKQTIQDPDYSRHLSMGWNYRMPELCAAVALGQLESADALVGRRIEAAGKYLEAVKGTKWLKPQYVGEGYECTYWSFAVKLEHPGITWREFRDRFTAFGGDGIYAAWKLTYLEPMMTELHLLGRDSFITEENKNRYRKGLCPVAEDLQGKLLQFKTNYWRGQEAQKQADILKKTIEYFNKWGVAE
jgi:perosamine synthetase